MGLFSNRKRTSSSVAKDRLKLVLVYDRTGAPADHTMLRQMKRDLLAVIKRYIDIDEESFSLDIKESLQSHSGGSRSELVAVIPIQNVRHRGRGDY